MFVFVLMTVNINPEPHGWRAAFYTDLDGERSVADLVEFKPMDWRAMVRLVQ
jgi:hypothetical protein